MSHGPATIRAIPWSVPVRGPTVSTRLIGTGRTDTTTRGDETMPLYLSKFSYTPETWARLIAHPEDRRQAAQDYIESVGGKLHGFWYAFGEHDGYNLWEAPPPLMARTTAAMDTLSGASHRL